MKSSVSKTVHVDKRPSFAGNLVTIFAGRAERTAETTAMRQNLPGKSHVGRILLNDNTSQERLLDMRLSDIHNAQKKTATFISHQKKTFVNRMEHRQSTWVREHARRATILNSLASKKRDSFSKCAESQDMDEGEEEASQEVESGNAKGNTDAGKNKPTDGKEKVNPHATSGGLPEISSAQSRTRLQRARRNGPPDDQTSLSLPNIQRRHRQETDKSLPQPGGAHLPSVLITTAERDVQTANQEATPRSAGSSAGKRKKKPRRHRAPTEAFERPVLNGPSPTFISEVLPRIQIRESVGIPTHLSKKSRRRRRKRSTSNLCEGDPLADDRFLRLQHTLAPHLAWQESRDMASISAGVVAAKKLISEKVGKFSRMEEESDD